MRRILSFILFTFIVSLPMWALPAAVQGQFATNTPGAPENDNTTQPADDTGLQPSDDQPLAGFATNTPDGPVVSPTPSATATATATVTPSPTDTPTITPTPNGPFSYPEGVNPLTGLPYPNDEAMQRRNLIVKISNFPPLVRPQHGPNQADIVYEYEAEGGVTRFAAIFRTNAPERVGSIRSARLLDLELVTMYRALLAYSGTSEPIQQMLLGEGFFEYQLLSPLIGHNCADSGFCRDNSLGVAMEHTLFGNTVKMWETATRQNTNIGYQARGFAFSEQPDPDGSTANDIFVQWYGQTDARWQWDETSQRWLRYTDGVPHYDKYDGEQLWADNLVIIQVPHERRPDLFPPGANYESLEVQLWDQGRAMVAREGQIYEGFWRRQDKSPGSALQLLYGNNTPIMLKPGRTWISIVRGFGDVVVSEEKRPMPEGNPPVPYVQAD